MARQDVTPIIKSLHQVEQKLDFFHACTMRRSSAAGKRADQRDGYAAEAERIAEAARAAGSIDRLVAAYKALERIEARLVELLGTSAAGEGPEPRMLDLPRARVLLARRAVGSAVAELDSAD